MVAVCWPCSLQFSYSWTVLCSESAFAAFHRSSSDFPDTFQSQTTTVRNRLNALVNWIRIGERSGGAKKTEKRTPSIEMIPDTESVCQTSEAAVRSTDVYQKIKNAPEGEAASVTAWKRYQQLVAIVETRGGKFNRKSMIEAIFRGSDLVYASH
ncbi:uncharacterized protein LOC128890064 [Hylaeus anthracinus]|uniref:uncharacterized protein LOC128890064 n=1 Tax=Hylaeus anthracinus TaxID=313031 RepID=UPI0023BA39F8|nr:uncharacterized protein LOC128890064 [Hylaeus anthracinus]